MIVREDNFWRLQTGSCQSSSGLVDSLIASIITVVNLTLSLDCT
jgi:hypothetical protein